MFSFYEQINLEKMKGRFVNRPCRIDRFHFTANRTSRQIVGEFDDRSHKTRPVRQRDIDLFPDEDHIARSAFRRAVEHVLRNQPAVRAEYAEETGMIQRKDPVG